MSGKWGILQTKYTGTSSTDVTLDSVARLRLCGETLWSSFSQSTRTGAATSPSGQSGACLSGSPILVQ